MGCPLSGIQIGLICVLRMLYNCTGCSIAGTLLETPAVCHTVVKLHLHSFITLMDEISVVKYQKTSGITNSSYFGWDNTRLWYGSSNVYLTIFWIPLWDEEMHWFAWFAHIVLLSGPLSLQSSPQS